jgi:hypothetical protein
MSFSSVIFRGAFMKRSFLIAVLLLVPLVAQAQTPSWQYTGSLNTDRWLSEMVTLDNNTVLVVGGYQAQNGALASCEIYDPATASWTYTGSLTIARAMPTLVKLPNGHVLSLCGATTFGGTESTGSVEEYDPATGTWKTVGSLQVHRMLPTATTMTDGKILIAGGLTERSGTTTSCEVYDPSTNTSVLTGSLAQNRYAAQAVLLGDGRVMVAGGRDGGSSSNYFSECEIFDPTTDTWDITSPMHQARIVGILTKFSDNTILAAAGRNSPSSSATGSEIFTLGSMQWQSTDPIKQPVCWAGNVPFPDDRFMTTAGIVTGNWSNFYGLEDVSTSTCEWYDRNLQQWYYAPSLNLTRCKHNAVYVHQTANPNLPTDLVLVAGGKPGVMTNDSMGKPHVDFSFTNTAEVLDVTVPALAMYMKQNINAVKSVDESQSSFRPFYQADGSVLVKYSMADDSQAILELMSVDGRVVRHLMNVPFGRGVHEYVIHTNDLSAGTYFVRYSSGAEYHFFKFIVAR